MSSFAKYSFMKLNKIFSFSDNGLKRLKTSLKVAMLINEFFHLIKFFIIISFFVVTKLYKSEFIMLTYGENLCRHKNSS